MSGLCVLPFDLFSELFLFLFPKDILAFCQCTFYFQNLHVKWMHWYLQVAFPTFSASEKIYYFMSHYGSKLLSFDFKPLFQCKYYQDTKSKVHLKNFWNFTFQYVESLLNSFVGGHYNNNLKSQWRPLHFVTNKETVLFKPLELTLFINHNNQQVAYIDLGDRINCFWAKSQESQAVFFDLRSWLPMVRNQERNKSTQISLILAGIISPSTPQTFLDSSWIDLKTITFSILDCESQLLLSNVKIVSFGVQLMLSMDISCCPSKKKEFKKKKRI